MIKLTIPVEPYGKGRPRFKRVGKFVRTYTPPKSAQAENAIKAALAVLHKSPALTGPLKVSLRFVMRRPKRTKNVHPIVKPDIDNVQKLVCDSANGILWVDDAQLVHVDARKVYDLVNPVPRIELTVEAMP